MLVYFRFRRLHFGYTLAASASCLQLESSSRSGLPLPSPSHGAQSSWPQSIIAWFLPRDPFGGHTVSPLGHVIKPHLFAALIQNPSTPWTLHSWRSRLRATLQPVVNGLTPGRADFFFIPKPFVRARSWQDIGPSKLKFKIS